MTYAVPPMYFTDSGDRWLNLFDSALAVCLVSTLISLSIMGLVLRRQVDWVKLIRWLRSVRLIRTWRLGHCLRHLQESEKILYSLRAAGVSLADLKAAGF